MESQNENETSYKEEVSNRWEHCRSCKYFNATTKQCKQCGCFMFIKIFIPQAECPVGKW